MREPSPLPLAFRPSTGLRVSGLLVGLVCLSGAVASVFALLRGGGAIRFAAAVVLMAACLIAAALVRRVIVVDVGGLTVSGIVTMRRIAWPEVIAIEQTRRSFVIITEQGDVSAGWIDAGTRDLLFRKILEQARLSLDPHEQRWGITGRFVRRSQGVIAPSDILRSSRSERPKNQ